MLYGIYVCMFVPRQYMCVCIFKWLLPLASEIIAKPNSLFVCFKHIINTYVHYTIHICT